MRTDEDIRTADINGLEGLRGLNRVTENSLLKNAGHSDMWKALHGDKGGPMANPADPIYTEGRLYRPDEAGYHWGESRYDSHIGEMSPSFETMQQERYNNQSSWDVLGNGLAKMFTTAGSTIASTLVGLPVGLGYAVGEGRWSGIWDNPFMDALAEFDDNMRNTFKNYQSLEQQQNTENGQWWKNMGSMNWWADDVITNIGFTLGAMASGAVIGGGLGAAARGIMSGAQAASRASRIAPTIANGITSLISASGEAAIEANNNTREWKKGEYQKLDDSLDALYANDERVVALRDLYQERAARLQQQMQSDPNIGKFVQQGENGMMVDPVIEQYRRAYAQLEQDMKRDMQAIDEEKEQRRVAGRAQIDEDARRAGNRIMAANQAFLSIDNLFTIGKVFDKSFKSASKFQNLMNAEASTSMIGSRAAGLSTAEKSAAAQAGELYKSRSVKNQLARDWLVPLAVEGQEEMNQRFISSGSTAYYQREDPNDYWRSRLDETALQNTIDGSHDFGMALSKGFQDSWGNPAAWEEFVIGSMTGLGSAMVQNKFGTNTINQVREAHQNASALNTLIGGEDYFNKLAGLSVSAAYYEQQKEDAAKADDIKAWKDADDKEMAHIIETYYRAGKLNDLKEDIEAAGGELSDEDVQKVIESTTRTPEQTKDMIVKPMRDEVAQLGDEVTELERQLAALQGTQQPAQSAQPTQQPAQQPQQPQQSAGQQATEQSVTNSLNRGEFPEAELKALIDKAEATNDRALAQRIDNILASIAIDGTYNNRDFRSSRMDASMLRRRVVSILNNQQQSQNAQEQRAIEDNLPDLDAAIGGGGLGDVDPNKPADGSTNLFSEAEDADKEKQDNIARLQEEIAKKRARIAELNAKIDGTQGTLSGPFVENGNTVSIDEARRTIEHNKDAILDKISDYVDSMNSVRYRTKGLLNNETENELSFLHFVGKSARKRLNQIADTWQTERIPDRLHILWDEETDGSLDELKKKLGSQRVDVVKDDSTPEGAVTLDLSKLKADKNNRGWLIQVINNFLAGRYLAKDKDDTDTPMLQTVFATKQLSDFAQANGLDEKEHMDRLIRERDDAIKLNDDANAYDKALDEAIANPAKLRKKAKRLKQKVQKKLKDKKDSSAWENATFEDYVNGKLDGIEPKTEAQKKKQRGFEKRAGIRRDMRNTIGGMEANDAQKQSLLGVLDSVIDGAMDEEGNIDDNAIHRFLEDPESAIRNMFQMDGELFDRIVAQADRDSDDAVEGVIQQLAALLSGVSDTIFSRLEESEKHADDVEIDDELLEQGAEETEPDLPDNILERQPTDVAPVEERPVTQEERERRGTDTTPITPTPAEQQQAVEQAQSPFGEPYVIPEGRAWRMETTETAYGNEHQPFHIVAREKLRKLREQQGSNFSETTPFRLFPVERNGKVYGVEKNAKQWEALIKRSEAIWKYMKRNGVYDYVNDGNVKAGDAVYFATDPELNKEAGALVLLMVDEHGRVIGNIPDKAVNSTIASLQDRLQSIYDAVPEDEKTGLYVFDKAKYKTKVATRYMGGAKYDYRDVVDDEGVVIGEEKDMHNLAELAAREGKPVIIGVALTDNDIATGDEELSQKVIKPKGKAGQPYVIIESKGAIHDGKKYTTAPISIDRLDKGMTPIVGLLKAIVNKAMKDLEKDTNQTKLFLKLRSILNIAGADFSRSKSGGITIKVRSRRKIIKDGKEQNYNFYHHIRSTNIDEDFDMWLDQLVNEGIGINVNLYLLKPGEFQKSIVDYLKDEWETTYGEMPTDYTAMIASLVETNVGSLTTHGEWFDIDPIQVNGDSITTKSSRTAKPTATQRQPHTQIGQQSTPKNLRQAKDDTEKLTQNEFMDIINESMQQPDDKQRKQLLWNRLIAYLGAPFMRTTTGIELAKQLNALKPGDIPVLSSFMWNMINNAKQERITREACRNASQREVGPLVQHEVEVTEENGEHIYNFKQLGKKLKGITSTLLKKISERLYGNVPKDTLNNAAKRGSVIHEMIEAFDQNKDFVPPKGVDYDMGLYVKYKQYLKALDNAGLTVIANEYAVTDGTAFGSKIDLVMVDEHGNIVLGDIKTTRDSDDPQVAQNQKEYVTSQLSIYRNMFKSQNPGKNVLSRGVVMHINNNRIQIEWVDLYDEKKVDDRMREYRDQHGMEQPQPAQPTQHAQPEQAPTAQPTRGETTRVFNKETRIADAKLYHKDEIIDVMSYSDSPLLLNVNHPEFPDELMMVVYYERGKFRVQVQEKQGFKAIQGTPQFEAWDHIWSPEEIQQVVDRYIPKDLQQFILSGEESRLSMASQDRADRLFPDSLRDRINYMIHDPENFAGILKKNWGIYWEDPYTQDNNFDEPTPSTQAQPAAPAQPIQPVQTPTSLYEQYKQVAEDAEEVATEEEFNAVFKGGDTYVDSQGGTHTGNDALSAFSQDYEDGTVPGQDELLSEVREGELPVRMNLDEELSWLEKALPQFSKGRRLKLRDTLIQASNDRVAYGMFSNGIIYVYKYGAQGTIYHEAFHAVTQGLLTDDELTELYNAAREKYGDLPIVQLEEKLAEDFQRFMIEGKYYQGREKNVFQKLWDAIRQVFGKRDVIDNVYNNICAGVYGHRVVKASSNVFSTIRYQEIQENRYKMSNTIDDTVREAIRDADVTMSEFNEMTSAQKYIMKHCLV